MRAELRDAKIAQAKARKIPTPAQQQAFRDAVRRLSRRRQQGLDTAPVIRLTGTMDQPDPPKAA